MKNVAAYSDGSLNENYSKKREIVQAFGPFKKTSSGH